MAGKGNVAVFSKKRRWAEIDIFRGLAISCMLIVNALPDFSEAYPLLLYIFTEISLMLLWTIKTSSGQLLYAWLWENSLKGVVSVPFSIFLFAFLWLALWLLAAGYLARKHIFLRV